MENHQRLADDHKAVDEVLTQLLTALQKKDVHASHEKLDLLWARLAVHIRAEHLHLFPTVLGAATPDLTEAPSVVEKLRGDHDFFMHELARAIAVLRELAGSPGAEAQLTSVNDIVREVAKRLSTHNEIEENKIYLWASTILTDAQQTELAKRIDHELDNRPSRFSVAAWANE